MRLPDGPVRVVGRGSHDAWAFGDLCEQTISVEGGVRAFSPADQFITVGAGMLVSELRAALAAQGQMIPLLEPFMGAIDSSPREGEDLHLESPSLGEGEVRVLRGQGAGSVASPEQSPLHPPRPNPLPLGSGGEGARLSPFETTNPHPSRHVGTTSPCKQGEVGEFPLMRVAEEGVSRGTSDGGGPSGGEGGTIGGLLSMALPHPAEAQFFDWRSWVLGMTIMRADGMIVKSGSTVVKSVAGFDVFKLLVGARGTLGIILEVTLRTMGQKELIWPVHQGPQTECTWIQRVLPADLEALVEKHQDKLVAWDEGTATLWASEPLPRIDGDWAMTTHPEKGHRFRANEPEYWLRRLKAELDPENKLNPGGLGDLI